LTVRAYGAKPAPFTLYEDDGISYDYERGMQNRITLSWTPGEGGKMERRGDYSGPDRYQVKAWKAQDGVGASPP